MSGRAVGGLLLVGGLLALLAAQIAVLLARADAAVPGLAVVGVTASLCGMMLLAAPASGVSRPLALAVAVTALIVGGGFALGLILPAESGSGPLWWGVPRRAAIILIGVGLLPAAVLPWAYLRDCRRAPLDAAAVAQLVAECRAARAEQSPP